MTTSIESTYLRLLPSIDRLLRTKQAVELRQALGSDRVTAAARRVTDELRREIQEGAMPAGDPGNDLKEQLLERAIRRLENTCKQESQAGIRPVINATGVILHTNLGRAPLSERARAAVTAAAGYCTLEYDPSKGARGRRGANVENLLIQLTGAEDALVVNNCAAAALLVLKVLAGGGETIVSRGELVEIGGDFRIPDVMANSGTRMVEVGSTNRTRLEDYRVAISERTRLIMRVHPSNYRIVGFTTSPVVAELAECAHSANLFLYEDAGSGVLLDLTAYGLADEPLIKDCLAQGADVVSFSGDKLLGSAQAGLIVGRREIIERLRKDSLYRALRADKLCLAALEATLETHLQGLSFSEIPALRMLAMAQDEIEIRARNIVSKIAENEYSSGNESSPLRAEVIIGESAIGGGCGPNVQLPTILIALTHEKLSADSLEHRLRANKLPIIARVANGRVLLDLRTVPVEDEQELIAALRELQSS
jgi:L-seryl-tRNA(Ser) seleniumtransferase